MKYALMAILAIASPSAFAAVNINPATVGAALLFLIGWALILYVLWWGLGKINPVEPWKTIGIALLVILTVVVAIDFISSVFFSSPMFTFR